jgi:hypothetical protein
MPPSPYQSGSKKAGFTRPTPSAGFNGIAVITWVAAYRKKIYAKSKDGKPWFVISPN